MIRVRTTSVIFCICACMYVGISPKNLDDLTVQGKQRFAKQTQGSPADRPGGGATSSYLRQLYKHAMRSKAKSSVMLCYNTSTSFVFFSILFAHGYLTFIVVRRRKSGRFNRTEQTAFCLCSNVNSKQYPETTISLVTGSKWRSRPRGRLDARPQMDG